MTGTRTGTQRLGAYVLPGRSAEPSTGVLQAQAGERIGLGSIWLSERLGSKDIGTIGGALTQATSTVTIGAAATHIQTRHPVALASLGLTLQALSGGRFVLGIGRASPLLWRVYGLPDATNQVLVDGVSILRRLWAGETVSYSGPLGNFPRLRLGDVPAAAPPPVALTAIGPRSLALAGRHFDGVLLHPFLTLEGQARSAEIVRKAAAEAGRDPDSVRIYGMVVAAPDCTPEQTDLRVRARAVTYFNSPALARSLLTANGWDLSYLDRLNEHPLIKGLAGRPADRGLDYPQLVELSRIFPDEWYETGAAIGTAAECAGRLHAYLGAGADELVIHGSTPDVLGPLVDAFTSSESSDRKPPDGR